MSAWSSFDIKTNPLAVAASSIGVLAFLKRSSYSSVGITLCLCSSAFVVTCSNVGSWAFDVNSRCSSSFNTTAFSSFAKSWIDLLALSKRLTWASFGKTVKPCLLDFSDKYSWVGLSTCDFKIERLPLACSSCCLKSSIFLFNSERSACRSSTLAFNS